MRTAVMTRYGARAVLLLLILGCFISGSAFCGEPGDLIDDQFHKVQEEVANFNRSGAQDRTNLRTSVLERIQSVFDFREMTRQCLGSHQDQLSDQQFNQLNEVFRSFLLNLYRVRLLGSEDFYRIDEISIDNPKIRGSYAMVRGRVRTENPSRGSIPVTFMLVKQDSEWKVYDLEIDGFSLVSNYRAQFHEILGNGSPDRLIKILREKTSQMSGRSADT